MLSGQKIRAIWHGGCACRGVLPQTPSTHDWIIQPAILKTFLARFTTTGAGEGEDAGGCLGRARGAELAPGRQQGFRLVWYKYDCIESRK